MPMFDRNHRDSTVLPTMKCAQCNQDVHIRLIGQHDCTAQPAIPNLPAGLMGRGLSSFFRAPQQGGEAYKPSQKFLGTEETTADEFDFDEMLHSASDFSIPSCENGRPAVAKAASRMPFLPMFSNSSSSASVDSLTPGCFSPLEMSRVPGDSVYMPPPPPPPGILMPPPPRAEPLSAPTHLDRARDELMQQTSRATDPFLSPESEPPLSFESRGYPSHQQQNMASVLRPTVNNSSSNGNSNNGHKKTGSIAITAFPPVSPPDGGPKATGTTVVRRNNNDAAAIVPMPPADLSRGVGATQIRISSRKAIPPPASCLAEFVPTSSSSSSPSKAAGAGLSLQSSTMAMPERKITRNVTAPPSMNAGSLPSRQQSPLDVLASLVSVPVAVPPMPAAGLPPRIDTQVRGRGDTNRPRTAGEGKSLRSAKLDTLLDDLMSGTQSAGARIPTAAATVRGKTAVGTGKSLKSAKLDSLLDDLMGEMQALSAEVRTESDRESVVSTASNPTTNVTTSPVDGHRQHGARARFDSSVSSASSSSTLSSGRRGAACATCGTAIAGIKGAVVRSSSAALHNGEVAPGTAAVEHLGRVYCVRDYKRAFATSCRACDKACDTTSGKQSVFALDAWWHRSCFNCQECRQGFPDKSFYVLDQRPYCRYDYHKLNRSLCVACAEPIEGPCAQVMEGRFHPNCFACAHCGEHLKDVYYSLNGRFLCEAHVHQQAAFGSADKRKTVYSHV